MKYIKNGKIITRDRVLENHVLVFDKVFMGIIEEKDCIIKNDDVIDANNLYIAPGLIDVHIHGYYGHDVMDGTEEGMNIIRKELVKKGVTSFLATTMTMDWQKVANALTQIRNSMAEDIGAKVLGAHLEGPFISDNFRGAQPKEHIIEPNLGLIEGFLDVIKIITVAPEVPHAIEFIKRLKNENIIVSLGHSGAKWEEAVNAISAGATHITHLFNAMSGVHHREPGLAGVALAHDVYCELIPDGIHTHYGIFQLLKNCKKEGKIILITDCVEAGGMKDGVYELGGQEIIVKGNCARRQDGTLSGSVMTLNKGVQNFYKNTDATICQAINMASMNPAIELGIDKEKGSIEISKEADFFLMDEDFEVEATYINGKQVFKK